MHFLLVLNFKVVKHALFASTENLEYKIYMLLAMCPRSIRNMLKIQFIVINTVYRFKYSLSFYLAEATVRCYNWSHSCWVSLFQKFSESWSLPKHTQNNRQTLSLAVLTNYTIRYNLLKIDSYIIISTYRHMSTGKY